MYVNQQPGFHLTDGDTGIQEQPFPRINLKCHGDYNGTLSPLGPVLMKAYFQYDITSRSVRFIAQILSSLQGDKKGYVGRSAAGQILITEKTYTFVSRGLCVHGPFMELTRHSTYYFTSYVYRLDYKNVVDRVSRIFTHRLSRRQVVCIPL